MRTILLFKGFILSKAEQLGLFAAPVQVAGSVDKHGTVRKPHVRIQKVRAKEAPAAPRKPAAEDSPKIGARLRAWLDKHGGLSAVAKIVAEAPESARTKMLEIMAGVGRASVEQVRAMLEGAKPGAAQADLFSAPAAAVPASGDLFSQAAAKVEPKRAEAGGFVTPPKLDKPVIEHEGESWYVINTGAAREDGKVFAHLSSVTRGRPAKNGIHPLQIADWVDRAKLGMAPPDEALPIVEHTTKKGKTLRGVVRADLTKEEAQAIDPYTFRKDGGWFIREKHLGNVALTDEGKTAQPVEDAGGAPAPATREPIDWEARAAENRRLNTYAQAEQAAAAASLQPGDVIRSRIMDPSVTGIVEKIVGPGDGDDRTQVQLRWADNGKPRKGNGHGTRGFYSDFFLRDGVLYTSGLNDSYPPEAWERVGVNPGTQLDLGAAPKAVPSDASRATQPLLEALPFGVPVGTTKAERRRLNAEVVELVRRGGPYSEAEKAALRQYSGTGGVGDSLNEFYTLPEVATAMWSVAARLGLEAGDVLEPSCGAGVFLHTAPAGVKVTGVELDTTSSAVAKALHGDRHEIRNASLERFAQEDVRRFKAVIGNVPFGLRGSLIKDDKPHLKTAEAYFCDTALDKCEPGGLVGLIVPTGVMDGKNNRALRERLLRKGEFLGAQRMPNTAFEHSHTEVTTDVLWFRKRPDDVAGALSHASVTQKMLRELGVWDDEFLSGGYFTGRGAGNIFGSMEAGWRAKAGMGADITVVGSMRGVPEALAEFAPDVGAASPSMQAILAQFDGDEAARAKVLGAAMTRPYEAKAKVGDTKTVDGVVYVLQGQPPRWHRVDEVLQSDALTRAQAIARELDDLIEGRRGVDRAQLEKDLQAWVDEYGAPSRNKDVLLGAQQDRVLYRLIGAVKADGSLSDAVRGVAPQAVKGSFESTVTAMLLDREAVSVEDIAARAGVDAEEALDHLYASPRYAFDPQAGRWTTRDIYLSGDLWAKLDAVRASLADADTPAELRKKLEGQEAALSAAIEPASLEDVFVQMNSAFVPTEVLAAFWNWKYHDSPAANDWTKKLPPVEITFENGLYRIQGGNEYGDQKLLDKYLNRTGLRKDDKPTIDALNDEFKDWLCASSYREQLEELYNRKFRGYVPREFSNEPMDIPGLAGEGLKDYQWGGLRWALNAGKGIIAADVGLGKAQPLDAKILTPAGWRRMGDLQVGDEVIAGDGTVTVVTGVFPQGDKEIFKVKFHDGAETECCDEHLWLTQTTLDRNNQRRGCADKGVPKVRTLAEIRGSMRYLGREKNHTIPMVGSVEFAPRSIPLDPYLMGVLLGDGGLNSRTPRITNAEESVLDACRNALPTGMVMRPCFGDRYSYNVARADTSTGVNVVGKAVASLGVNCTSHTKFIPDEYKFNSPEVRIQILQGLMDADGYVCKTGVTVQFTSVSERLAKDVQFMVQSLGGNATIKSRVTSYTHKGEKRNGSRSYTVHMRLPPSINPFRHSRKRDRVRPKSKYLPTRYIVGVESVGTKAAQCISVAHPSRLYVTDDFIVTHNTARALLLTRTLKLSGRAQKPLIVVPKSVLANWFAECEKWFPGSRVMTIGGSFEHQADGTLKGKDDTAAERKRKYHDIQQNDYDFIICSEPAFEEVDLDPATKNDYNARDFWVQRGDRLGNEGDKRTKKIREAWEQSRAGQEFGESSRTDATYFNELGVDALITDEMHHCFPAGTLVDGRRIETLKAGDLVKSFNHETGAIEEKPVLAVARLPAKPLARVTLSNGQKIVSTFDHLFFTLQSGYTPAQHLTGFSDVIISTITTSMVTSDGRLVQGVREYIHPVAVAGLEGGRRSESVLQQGVLSSASQKAYDAQTDDRQDVFGVREAVRVEQSAALEDGVREGPRVLLRPEMRNSLEKFQAGGSGLAEIAGNSEEAQRSAERAQLASDARGSPEKDGGAQGYWSTQPRRTASQGREWSGAVGSAGHACRGTWVEDGICCADQRAEGLGVSVALQDRHCEPGSQDCNRGRWEQPCERCAPSSGREEGRLLGVARVVSVEILQPGGDGEFERLCPEGDVYDIEVADNHNFFAEGVLVHNCKNLYAAKSRFGDQPKFLGGQGLSMRALDFNLKARWILDQNDGKNVYGLTATPTKNSPLEIYSMLSHVAPEAFERIGVRNSEEFLDRFAKFEDGMALNTRGEMEEALVTSGFRNMDELRAIMQRYIHRQTADDVGLKLPGRDDRTHFVEMDDEQQKVYAELRELAEESGGKDATGDAHIFSIMDKMNKAAMDLSLLDPDQYAGRSSPKYQACAEQVVAGLRDGGQIIFADYVDAHDKMVEALVRAGIPRGQIGVINAKVAGSAVKRQQIADAFNAGKLRVVIGNTATMGEGLNLQKGTADIHHLDLPWEPASMQQRNGRGLRQGNTNASIRIHSYLARGSFDGYRYQSMMAKKDWQDLIWSGGDELENLSRQGNVSRDEMMIMLAADPDQARAAFEANTKAKEERFAAGKRAEAAGRFVKFQSLKRSFGELKNKDTASAQRLKTKIDRERAALAADRHFPAKDALDLDNVVIEPESGRAIVAGHGLEFEEDGKPDRYVVTGTDYRTGAVTVRRYGETSGVKRTWPLEKLKGSKAYAYDDKAEAAEIGRRLEEEAKAGATKIKSLDEVMKLPPRIAAELHGQLQETLWKGAKDYTININGKVPMVEKATGKPVIAESYNVRQLSPETHDFMLPTEENRERAIQGWMEARRASSFGTDTNQARRGGRTTTVAKRKYGVLQNDNPWSRIVATMHGEEAHYGATPPSVKAARARLEKEQNERILRAKSLSEAFDHAAAIGKIAEPSQGYGARVTLPKKTLATLWAKAKRLGVLGESIEAHTPTAESKTYPKHSSYFVGRTGTARSTLLRMTVGSGHNDLVRAMVESSLPTMEPRDALEALGAVSAGYGLGEGGMRSDRARAMIALAEKAGVMDVTKDALGFRDGYLGNNNPWAPDRRDTVRTILERELAHATERERAAADAIDKVA